jgi:hypothetical protein
MIQERSERPNEEGEETTKEKETAYFRLGEDNFF